MAALPFTLRQLEIFEVICELRSFRLASEKLGISQASVSNQLKVLEDQLGTRLLARDSGRRPRLTPEGASFLSDLAPFWKASDKLAAHRLRSAKTSSTGQSRVKVMISLQILEQYVRPKLGHFLRTHPDIQLMFDSAAAYFGPRASLTKEYFDIGLFTENASIPLVNGFEEAARIRCGIFGPCKLAEGRTLPLTPDELNKLPFVLPSSGSFHESETLSMLARHDIKPAHICARTQYFDVLSALIETEDCVGVSLDPPLRPKQHATVAMLHRLEDWRLAIYRNPLARQPQTRMTEEFLISAILDDPAFPLAAEVV